MDIINVIDKLEALVDTSRRVPTTRARLVDADKVMELVEQLRLVVPQDIRSAQEVIEKKDNILNQAQMDARRTRNEAEEEYSARVDQNEIVLAARKISEQTVSEVERKASRMTEQAELEARTSRSDADAYVAQTLRNLENELTRILSSVRKGLESLGATVHV